MATSTIEWTNATWNPVTGCNKVSPGCKFCYAERMSHRLKAMGVAKYDNAFALTLHPQSLEIPLQWKRPQTIFVNSMSDLFHDQVPEYFIKSVFDIMRRAYWHTFQVLTKRSERLAEISSRLQWSPNVWMGVSVENNDYAYRIHHLLQTQAHVKFLSLEPLLGHISKLPLKGIDWVIVGGESGPGARPIQVEWVRRIRDKCAISGTPFFFKQWGGSVKSRTGRILDGLTWDEMPRITGAVMSA